MDVHIDPLHFLDGYLWRNPVDGFCRIDRKQEGVLHVVRLG